MDVRGSVDIAKIEIQIKKINYNVQGIGDMNKNGYLILLRRIKFKFIKPISCSAQFELQTDDRRFLKFFHLEISLIL